MIPSVAYHYSSLCYTIPDSFQSTFHGGNSFPQNILFFSLLFFQKDHENVEAPFYYLAKEFHNLYKEKVEQMKTLTQDFHFRRVLSSMRGEVDLFIAQLLLSVLENRSVNLSSTQGTYIRVQLLEDISAQSLKVSLFIIVIFSCKILASSSLCLVFKHSGDVCSYHSTQSMRTDS